MVYLMTLFARSGPNGWVVDCRSVERCSGGGDAADKLPPRNYEEPFFLDYTKHPPIYITQAARRSTK